MSLDDLARYYGTDKSSLYHGYTAIYERYLRNYRFDITKVLEIGYEHGASAKMWMVFPNSQLHIIEYDPSKIGNDSERLIFHRGDSGDRNFLQSLDIDGLDLVIDDGNHYSSHIISAFEVLFPRIRSGGLYVVEDTHCSYLWEKQCGHPSCVDYFKSMVDEVNSHGLCGLYGGNKAQTVKEWGEKLSYWAKNIDSIHFYQSLIFIAHTQ